jgi:uncharacterized protein YndB with AHSA1/START domain
MLGSMGVIEVELERTIRAPVEEVFGRLADIDGYDAWMPGKGSILRHSRQTSTGEPAEGTTFLDDTAYGPTPGEIVQFEAPHTLVFHWWDRSRSGRLRAEGWPGYTLQRRDDGATLLRHHATMHTYRLYRLATPVFRRIALKERTATVDALKASFETPGP